MLGNTLFALRLAVKRMLSRGTAPAPMSAFAAPGVVGTAGPIAVRETAAPFARARMRLGRPVARKEVTLLATLRRTPLDELDATVARLKAEASYAEVRKAFIDLIALAPLEELGALKHVYLAQLADDGDRPG
jgi:hypothetical protein